MNIADFLSNEMNTMTIDKGFTENQLTIDKGFTEENGIYKCNYCVGTYKRKGHLKTHLENKHNKVISLSCKCGKIFNDMTKLGRHEKSCK